MIDIALFTALTPPVCPAAVVLTAAVDVDPTPVDGFDPPYRHDALGALAIDASQFRGTAAVQAPFPGCDGVYAITLRALTEIDGESSYQVITDGAATRTVQNPTTADDYAPVTHVMSEGLALTNGTTLTITFSAHTNGAIPEGDGTAWSRGRWTHITFTRLSP